MDRATDERWRAALDKKGIDVVRQELDLRPGHPTELLYTVVDEPPYPTRAYCEAWCRGAPPKTTGVTRAGAMVTIMSLLVVVCVLRSIGSSSPADANWLSPTTTTYHQPRVSPAPKGGGSGGSDDGIQNSAAQNGATQNGSVIMTQTQGSLRSTCTSVASAGDLAQVQTLPACSKLGQPFVKQGNAPHS